MMYNDVQYLYHNLLDCYNVKEFISLAHRRSKPSKPQLARKKTEYDTVDTGYDYYGE